ncbi:MAG: hypothetical protein J5J06_00490 [Phycisphaerae bacterium]|nr:hypothetical protein [Phycisphaerae bacterium]
MKLSVTFLRCCALSLLLAVEGASLPSPDIAARSSRGAPQALSVPTDPPDMAAVDPRPGGCPGRIEFRKPKFADSEVGVPGGRYLQSNLAIPALAAGRTGEFPFAGVTSLQAQHCLLTV